MRRKRVVLLAAVLTAGKLDPRLFNVTGLVRAGYDDASRDRLPLIVDHSGGAPRTAGARVERELGAVAVSAARSADFWTTAREAEHVWLDGPVRASLDRSVPHIGAPRAWAAGHTGAGTTVAVLDTGIDTTHPDSADAVAGAANFTDSDSTDDRYGHGTPVASIVTGSGAAGGGGHRNAAPAGKRFTVPVYVQRNGADEVGGVRPPRSKCPITTVRRGGGPRSSATAPSGRRRSSTRATRGSCRCGRASPTRAGTRSARRSSARTRRGGRRGGR